MKILVIGDACTDVFVYGNCNRLSPEAPTPVMQPLKTINNPGMAGNVERNLRALGHDPICITNMKDMGKSFNTGPKYKKTEIIKTRYVDKSHNYILLRVDENDHVEQPMTISLLKNLVNYSKTLNGLHDFDLVIVSDYNKGFLSEEVMTYIFEHSKCSFLDTKRQIGEWAKDVTYIKINHKEFSDYNHQIFLETNNMINKTIVTEGRGGCRINGEYRHVHAVDVKDVAGAGDTFMAAVSTKFVETNDIWESMEFANKCAREVVQKRGVVTI